MTSSISAITYDDAVAVTASDSVNDPNGGSSGFAGLYVGGAGDIKVTTSAGTAVVLKAVPVGTFVRLRCMRVWSTGTTATNVVGLVAAP
jgi:hypothetical protein